MASTGQHIDCKTNYLLVPPLLFDLPYLMVRPCFRTLKDFPSDLPHEIIGHLPPDDKKLPRNSSLVAGSWTYPRQRHLPETVERLSESTL